ncbi:unnamed protein product [Linum trigynum]|uniref:Uncharacterized protein n=1 Tax=Linum trigynum TaxID=586398 RepID=A0AAV2FVJ0_9ROSI
MCFTFTPSLGKIEFNFTLHASPASNSPFSFFAFRREISDWERCSRSSVSSRYLNRRSSWIRECRGTTQNR